MENQNTRVSTQWEHSITNLLGHDPTSEPGIALRQWIHHQGVENILDLLSWEEDELKAIPAQQVFTLDDHGQGSYLRINQTKQICGLITYIKHVYREYMSGTEVITDRIPSTTPGAEPPRDARDSGSARSHSMHLETSSSDRP